MLPFSESIAGKVTSPVTLWDAAVDINLIVNSCHCVTIHRLHNRHLTRNVPLLSDQKGNRSKQLALGVSAAFAFSSRCTGLLFNSTWQVWPQQCSPLCRGILASGLELFLCRTVYGRGSPKPHTPFASWFPGFQPACEIKGSTWPLVTWQDLKSQSAFHILIDLIVRQTSFCSEGFSRRLESVTVRVGCDICKSPAMFSFP